MSELIDVPDEAFLVEDQAWKASKKAEQAE